MLGRWFTVLKQIKSLLEEEKRKTAVWNQVVENAKVYAKFKATGITSEVVNGVETLRTSSASSRDELVSFYGRELLRSAEMAFAEEVYKPRRSNIMGT